MSAFVGSASSGWSGVGADVSTRASSSSALPVAGRRGGVVRMSAYRFESGSGGLDRLTSAPHGYFGVDRLAAAPFGFTRFLFKDSPARTATNDSDGGIEAKLSLMYRHVFGNAYIMEEERAELAVLESQYKLDAISMRDFVRAVAKSNTYKKRFFESVSMYRFHELCFLHFLGRAPLAQEEISKKYELFQAGGYDAEIDSFFDSDEYMDVFGEDTAPYLRFRGSYSPNSTFNLQCRMQGGWARSDKNLPVLSMSVLAANATIPAYQVVDGLPPIPNSEHPSKKYEIPAVPLPVLQAELETAKAKVAEFQIQLDGAYASLEDSRKFLAPFMALAAEMPKGIQYGRALPDGSKDSVFAGKYLGTGSGEWGVTGAEQERGRTRRVALDIAEKEARLEKTKQLVVDLERAVSLIKQEMSKPPMTPAQVVKMTEFVKSEEQPTVAVKAVEKEPEMLGGKVKVEVVRSMNDIAILKEKPEVEESEGPKTFKQFDEDALPIPSFPGDGSEMQIGS